MILLEDGLRHWSILQTAEVFWTKRYWK
jgi:hypothetical protein